MNVLIVIPARYAAARLPGKPLADICGLPMIVRVYQRACRASCAAEVLVATDDARIAEAVRAHGGAAVMTRADHPSGTDRVAEVVARRGWTDLVLNVQGDEPLVAPQTIDALAAALADDPAAGVGTVAAPLSDPAAVAAPERVKVAVDARGRALYFSRQPIPTGGPWLQHVGMYGFRPPALAWFASRPPGRLERAERLEQLRFLEGGIGVRVLEVPQPSPAVDTADDLERVRRLVQHTPTHPTDR